MATNWDNHPNELNTLREKCQRYTSLFMKYDIDRVLYQYTNDNIFINTINTLVSQYTNNFESINNGELSKSMIDLNLYKDYLNKKLHINDWLILIEEDKILNKGRRYELYYSNMMRNV